ncbi:hypothetical protein [Nocardioides terrisoli]|uniref:hypothetical protein n=1 Tax=Nocardioides terrisoli TaxID=3388267 RepID=UPI00287BA584|nr:hypothetical protein [Nocardioides marmorisolisilvae]
MSEHDTTEPIEPKHETHLHIEGDGAKWLARGLVLTVGVFMAGLYGIAKQPEGVSKLEAIGPWFPWRKAKSSEPEHPTEPPAEIE